MLAIRNGYILSLDNEGRAFPTGDLLIDGGIIQYVGPRLESISDAAEVLDATDKLVMPGLVNAHAHTNELFNRGRFDNMILETWGLYAYPPLAYGPFSSRLLYLRTMVAAIEMLRGGVTCVQDDVAEAPRMTMEGTSAIRQAYVDSGMRATVACNQINRRHFEQYPTLREHLPPAVLDVMMKSSPPTVEQILSNYRQIVERWHNAAGGRLRVTLSFSAPQRCTAEYMRGLLLLAEECDLPLHMHILETKTQEVNSRILFGRSLVSYANDLGLLTSRSTIIHCIWVSKEDIALLGGAGVNVAHCPVANLKLGDGVMPLLPLTAAGVTVALGTDGPSSNDSLNLFETIKLAAILHKNSGRRPAEWATALDVLKMATSNGARSMLLEGQIGRLMPGYRADVILLDMNTPSFTPFNDPVNQLVYCENGSSVDTAIVDGKVVMRGRAFETLDDRSVLSEMRALSHEYVEQYERARKHSSELIAAYQDHAEKTLSEDVAMSRWFCDEP